MASPIKIALAGANGRLGQEITSAITSREGLELSLALTRSNQVTADSPKFDILIDVSTVHGAMTRLDEISVLTKPIIIGVTGFSTTQIEQIKTAAKTIPILLSGNFSLGVSALMSQVAATAKALGTTASVRIEETHHQHKKDHPSGTALMLADAVMDGIGRTIPIKTSLCPQKPAPIDPNLISIHSIREGEAVGAHSVIFNLDHEKVMLHHIAEDRQIFAQGALIAARWLVGKKPGLYAMDDVLNR